MLSAALLGLSLGALIAGPVSDKMGRKRVLVFSCLFFGLASTGTAWAQTLNTLTLWRFLTGLGLGAAMPNAITLISEFAPSAAAPWRLIPCTAASHWVPQGWCDLFVAYSPPWLAKRAADGCNCAADFDAAAGAVLAGVGEVSGAAREGRHADPPYRQPVQPQYRRALPAFPRRGKSRF